MYGMFGDFIFADSDSDYPSDDSDSSVGHRYLYNAQKIPDYYNIVKALIKKNNKPTINLVRDELSRHERAKVREFLNFKDVKCDPCDYYKYPCPLLLLACAQKNPDLELVQYFLKEFDVDPNFFHDGKELGFPEEEHESVSPLWAAVRNKEFELVKLLVERGAYTNISRPYGQYLCLIEANIQDGDPTILRYLMENFRDEWDDLNEDNEDDDDDEFYEKFEGEKKGTAYFVHTNQNTYAKFFSRVSTQEVYDLLVSVGFKDISKENYDEVNGIQIAAKHDRVKTVQLLMNNGADVTVEDKNGRDLVLVAAQKDSRKVVEFLTEQACVSVSSKIQALELTGANCVVGVYDALFEEERPRDLLKAFQYWEKSLSLREEHCECTEPKKIEEQIDVFNFQTEFSSEKDLVELWKKTDNTTFFIIQACLVKIRILGFKQGFYDCMKAVDILEDHLGYSNRNWRLQIQKWQFRVCISCKPGYFSAWRYCAKYVENALRYGGVSLEDLYQVLDTLIEATQFCLNEGKRDRYQQGIYQRMTAVIHVLFWIANKLYSDIGDTPSQLPTLYNVTGDETVAEFLKRCKRLANLDERDDHDKCYLHYIVNPSNPVDRLSYPKKYVNKTEKSMEFVVGNLVKAGMNIDHQDDEGYTPLQIALKVRYHADFVIACLYDHGAHIDVLGPSNFPTLFRLQSILRNKLDKVRDRTLQCLAATAVNKSGIPYSGLVPVNLEPFIKLH